MMMMKRLGVFLVLSLCLVTSVLYRSAGPASAANDRLVALIKQGGRPIKLEIVADGLTAPNWGTFAPGDSRRLFVTDQVGILWAIDLASGDKTVFLDVSDRLVAWALAARGPSLSVAC
jgi:hypothetical protein